MGWWIFGAIVVFLVLLLVLPIRICIDYIDDIHIFLSFCGIRFSLYPRKKKIRIRDYRVKKLQKRKKKALKKSKKRSERKKAHSMGGEKKKKTIQDHIRTLKLITLFLSKIQERLRNTFHIKIKTLKIAVTSEDAASTAMLYGLISGILAHLFAIADSFLRTTYVWKHISVYPDYCGTNFNVALKVRLSSNLFQLVKLIFSMFFAFLASKKETISANEKQDNKPEVQTNGKRQSH